jgi:hypothetical protein
MPPELPAFVAVVRRGIMESAKHSSVVPFWLHCIRRAFQLLKTSCLTAAGTDKDGGYLIAPVQAISRAHLEIVGTSDYEEWYLTSLPIQEAKEQYLGLSKAWESLLGIQGLRSKLCSFMLDGNASSKEYSLFCNLMVTAKTHKSFESGQLKWRNIHSVSSCWLPLSRLVGILLQDRLDSQQISICKNSQVVRDKLCTAPCSMRSRFMKLDIEHVS